MTKLREIRTTSNYMLQKVKQSKFFKLLYRLSLVVGTYHYLLAFFGAVRYGFPSRKLFTIGVTGTKGKSSAVEILNAVLEAAGNKTALLGTVRKKVVGETAGEKPGNTMPGRFAIQRFLREAVRAGAEYALLEVTSEGVLQHRHRFIDWDAAFFLNLAPEHIERHGSFENYRAAKVSFFSSLAHSRKKKRYFFVNEDDRNVSFFSDAARAVRGGVLVLFSQRLFLDRAVAHGLDFNDPAVRRSVNEWIVPDFNVMNAAAAEAFAESRQIPWETFLAALRAFKGVPGRCEFVRKAPFTVVVDYAHTPDSLRAIYEAVRPERLSGKPGSLICVLGSAGGGRDKWKRPEMGKIAAAYCDALVLTNEDPFDESPGAILDEIEKGAREANDARLHQENIFRIFDRAEAVRKAISLAEEGDTVVMTGKGNEPTIRMARGTTIPWSEREVVEELLRERDAK